MKGSMEKLMNSNILLLLLYIYCILGWPKVCSIAQKILKEFFGQPYILERNYDPQSSMPCSIPSS